MEVQRDVGALSSFEDTGEQRQAGRRALHAKTDADHAALPRRTRKDEACVAHEGQTRLDMPGMQPEGGRTHKGAKEPHVPREPAPPRPCAQALADGEDLLDSEHLAARVNVGTCTWGKGIRNCM